ncbi:MAG: riboflavin synthase [Planctomycetota bacterium]|mgnify:CR=1 FL=1|nr:MAG: riboflavin synthase [Planctomycetota bacterium]REK44431.1 MAG: riboflavin synthase [Planctomycetota bacterium]
MFTGLVEMLGTIASVSEEPPGRRLVVDAGDLAERAGVGASIAINGCCLTAIEVEPPHLSFEAGPETLARTNLGELVGGSRVNLEGSLRVGDQLGGHFVTGHVDAVGTLAERDDDGEWATLWFRVPAVLTEQMVSKGSIAVDGVSLTLVDVEADRFSVQLIPHTLAVTTLGALDVDGRVNLETDLLAKYAQKAVRSEI